MELIHARFIDEDGKTLGVEELAPSKDMEPELRITTGQRTAVTFGVDDVQSLSAVLTRFLLKHAKAGDE